MASTALKIMLLGDIGVGKTSLVRRLVFKTFTADYKATLGVDIYTYELSENRYHPEVSLAIWDVDGDFGPGIFKHIYIKGASAALILADITRMQTQSSAVNLSRLFETSLPGRPFKVIMNKTDLLEGAPGDVLADFKALGIDTSRTSAKSGENVEAAFSSLAKLCWERGL